MNNSDVAKILYEISELLKIKEVPFKPRAYEKAAITIEGLDQEAKEIYKEGGKKALDKLPGIGESISQKIEELLKTGKLKYYQKLKKDLPVDIGEMTRIEGLGPKTVAELYRKLKIKNIKELERAAKSKKIRKLEGFSERTEHNILESLGFLRESKDRMLLGDALPIAEAMIEKLKKVSGVKQIAFAGSLRRMQETIGDIDIIATSSKPKLLIKEFVDLKEVQKIHSGGSTRSSVRLKIGMDADLRVVKPGVFGAALQYFTGDKQHNIDVRKIAIKKGYKLNEYGLFKGKKLIACKTEEEIYQKLGMDTPPPEMRTASGEIEASKNKKLPKLINYGDIKGDLHMHTRWSDGNTSIEEMVKTAKKLGRKYVSITDHSKSLGVAGGLSNKELLRHNKEIDKLNKKMRGFKIFKGSEIDILQDGSLDYPNEILKTLDIVSIAIHTRFKMSKAEMTKRIVTAMKNPYVNILVHPTGRLLNKRKPYELDFDQIFKTAKEYGVAIEIDSFADRLDLKDEHIKKAVKMGVKLVIDSDAHDPKHLEYIQLGIGQARRGWATKNDILNTKSAEELIKTFKKMKK